MKIRQVGAELFHASRRKGGYDVTNSRFRNFAKAPKHNILIQGVCMRFLWFSQ